MANDQKVEILQGGAVLSTTNPLPVQVESGGSTQDVNIAQVAGATVDTGHGTAAGALRVELPTDGTGVVGLSAGQASIGNVGGKTVAVTVTPPVTATNAYGVNYVVGGLLTFANAFTSTGSGYIQSVTVTCAKVETVQFIFIPFNANPSATTWTDAAVAAINAADVAKVRSPVYLANSSVLGTHTVMSATGLGQLSAPGATTLYGVLIVTGVLTNQFAAITDITVTVTIAQDV